MRNAHKKLKRALTKKPSFGERYVHDKQLKVYQFFENGLIQKKMIRKNHLRSERWLTLKVSENWTKPINKLIAENKGVTMNQLMTLRANIRERVEKKQQKLNPPNPKKAVILRKRMEKEK